LGANVLEPSTDSTLNQILDQFIKGIAETSCVASNGYIYCIGGVLSAIAPFSADCSDTCKSQTVALASNIEWAEDEVIYAPLSSKGIGNWSFANRYGAGAIYDHSCVTANGYIYCVGGANNNLTSNGNNQELDQVWYAKIQANGSVGDWKQTTSYGGGAISKHSCTVVNNYVVCVGGGTIDNSNIADLTYNIAQVWAAPLSADGVGQWTRLSSFPTSSGMLSAGCHASGSLVFCVGGDAAYVDINGYYNDAATGASYFNKFTEHIELQDAASCSWLGGTWDAPSSTCTQADSTAGLGPDVALTIPAGVTFAVGNAANICSPAHDCSSTVAFSLPANSSIEVDGTMVIYGTFTNNGAIVNHGSVTNSGTFNNPQTATFANYPGGSFHNFGNLNTAGYFIVGYPAEVGNVTITVNQFTCGGLDSSSLLTSLVASDNPFVVFGTWNNGVCTIGYNQNTNLITPQLVPQGVVWQIPSGVTLLNTTALFVYGEIDNAGSLINSGGTVNGPGSLGLFGTLNNSGYLLTANGGSLSVSLGANLTNTGKIDLASVGLGLWGTLNNQGLLYVESGTTLNDFGTILNSGTVYNNGSISTTQSASATIVNSGNGSIVNQNGGTTNGNAGTITGTISAPVVELTQSSCQNLGAVWLAATSTCYVDPTKVITLDAGTILKIDTGVTLENFGQIGAPGEIDTFGTIINGGYLDIGSIPGTGNLSGGTVIIETGAVLSNFGQVLTTSQNSLVNNGTFTNVSASGISNLVAFDNRGYFGNTGTVNNFGSILNDNVSGGASMQNSGTITDLCSGTFQNSGGLYNGNPVVAGSCSSTVPLEPTQVMLTNTPSSSSAGQNITLTAKVAPSNASGTVTFFDGTTALGEATVANGQATLTTDALQGGVHSLTATYSGDSVHATSTSLAVTQNVSAQLNQPEAVIAYDFNGDGNLDLAVANSGANTVTIFNGQGNGAFTQVNSYALGNAPTSLAVGDVNGDGIADLVSANYTNSNVSVLLGNGDGTFRTANAYSAGLLPVTVAIGDVNGDGHPDLVVSNDGNNYVSVLLGNGDGSFGWPVKVTTGYGVRSVALGDFNGDGHLDIAVTIQSPDNQSPDNVTVLLGNGDGTFDAPSTYTNTLFSRLDKIVVADVNGDGHPDLVVTNVGAAANSAVAVMLGRGDGTFGTPIAHTADVGPTALVVADLNGDGKLDIATSHYDGTIKVLQGNGDGTFRAPLSFPAGNTPQAIAAGDLNNSGLFGVVTANYGSNDISVVLDPLGKPAGTTPTVSVTGGTFAYDGTPHAATCAVTDATGASVAGNCLLKYNGSLLPPSKAGAYNVLAVLTSADAQHTNAVGKGSLTITQVSPVVSVGGVFVYNGHGQPATCSATGIGGAAVSGTCSFSYNGSSTVPTNAGVYSVTGSFTSSDPNYSTASGSGNYTINPAPLTITANNNTYASGQAFPVFTASYSGFVNGETPAVLQGSLSFTTTANPSSPVGTYPITPSGLTSTNYAITYVNGTLTVVPPGPAAGRYTIKNVKSGLVLGVAGASTSSGANIVQWNSTGSPDQKWTLTPLGNGIYTIVDVNSGMVIGVPGASTSQGVTLVQWPSNGSTDQQWRFTASGSNWTITDVNSGLQLDIQGGSTSLGAQAFQWPFDSGASQQWTLIPTQ
jgi:hypothetical protein